MNTLSSKTLAQFHLKAPQGGIQPLRRDNCGRLIFSDGSFIDPSITGGNPCGKYDQIDWNEQEGKAFDLGKQHRLAKRKMSPVFRRDGRRYPDRVCRAYIRGFFSVPDWPKGGG